jgi:hypothetical protein
MLWRGMCAVPELELFRSFLVFAVYVPDRGQTTVAIAETQTWRHSYQQTDAFFFDTRR